MHQIFAPTQLEHVGGGNRFAECRGSHSFPRHRLSRALPDSDAGGGNQRSIVWARLVLTACMVSLGLYTLSSTYVFAGCSLSRTVSPTRKVGWLTRRRRSKSSEESRARFGISWLKSKHSKNRFVHHNPVWVVQSLLFFGHVVWISNNKRFLRWQNDPLSIEELATLEALVAPSSQ
jgi:hypothetical protein